jgi:hypothetical protein
LPLQLQHTKIERKKRKKTLTHLPFLVIELLKRQLKTRTPPPQIIIHLLDREADKARVILIYGEECFFFYKKNSIFKKLISKKLAKFNKKLGNLVQFTHF